MLPMSIVLVAIAGFSAAQPSAGPSAVPSPPRPAGDAGSWITVGDYPEEALAAHQAGSVGFRVNVDSGGNVTGCAITQSSGAPSLDQATCSLLRQRARFRAARDGAGKAVAGVFASHIQWVYPEIIQKTVVPAAPPPVEVREAVRELQGSSELWVGADGIIKSCERSPAPYANVMAGPDVCVLFPVGARYGPPTLWKGKPIRRKVTIHLIVGEETAR